MSDELYNEINLLINILLKDKVISSNKGMSKTRQRALRFLKAKNIVVFHQKKSQYQATTEILYVKKIGLKKFLKDLNYEKKPKIKKNDIFGVKYKYIFYTLFFITGYILSCSVTVISKSNSENKEIENLQKEISSNKNVLYISRDVLIKQNKEIQDLKKEIATLKKNKTTLNK